jgi:hypothetical protein
MIEFDNTTDPTSGSYGRPVVVTAKMDEQITWEQRFPNPVFFAANHPLTHKLRVEHDVVLLNQVEVGSFILMRLALQKVPIAPLGAGCWHAGKLREYRKFKQAVALLKPRSNKQDRVIVLWGA